MADTETIKTLIWAFVALAAIQGTTTYCVVQLLMTGRKVFERRDDGRVVRLNREQG